MTLTETNVYRITEWSGSGVKLELVDGHREINPGGGGSYDVAHVPDLSSKWSYQRGPRPDSPESSVRIDPKGRDSAASVLNYVSGSAVKVAGKDKNAASASRHAELTLSDYLSDDLLEGRPSPMSLQLRFQFDPDQKQVQATGHGSHKFEMRGQEGAVMTGTLDVTFTVDIGHEPEREEVEVSGKPAKGHGTWIPRGNVEEPKEPGNDLLEVTITVHKKGNEKELREATLKVSLPYVAMNKGVCGNWPRNVGEEEGLRFRQEDLPGRDGLLFKDRTHLETDVPVEEVTFLVRSHDYGAWGTVQVTAVDTDGKALEVRVGGKDTPDLDIPLDEDSHRVADGWERGKAYGRSRTDDDEAVAGQDTKGDGLTPYDEYRGLLVLENGRKVFRRLDPSRKELFVIDKGGSFDPVTWEKTALIEAFKVDEALTEADSSGEDAPMVNHLSLCEIDSVLQGVSREGPQAGDLRRRVGGFGLDGRWFRRGHLPSAGTASRIHPGGGEARTRAAPQRVRPGERGAEDPDRRDDP